MFKVIVERPRSRSNDGYHEYRAQVRSEDFSDPEGYDGPSKAGMKPPRHMKVARKELNENLSPLRRFLYARVGRPWAKVYSEICEHLSRDSATQAHVFQHLKSYVETNPMYRDGLPHEPDGVSFSPRFSWLYVDRKGFLREIPEKAKTRWLSHMHQDASNVRVQEDGEHAFVRVKGVWYEMTLEDHAPLELPECMKGSLLRMPGWPRHKVAVSKRQLSTREIKDNALNAPV
jgi:hypothetical protein